MIIYIDIDETICHSPAREYDKATPIKRNIDKVNKLYDEGHHIVYWTARGRNSGIDWHDLTESQLKKWGAKYHVLDTKTKPSYDLLICDKAMNTVEWE